MKTKHINNNNKFGNYRKINLKFELSIFIYIVIMSSFSFLSCFNPKFYVLDLGIKIYHTFFIDL